MMPLLQVPLVDSFGKGAMEESLVLSCWQDIHFSLGLKELLSLGCVPIFSMIFTSTAFNIVLICLHSKRKHSSFYNLK